MACSLPFFMAIRRPPDDNLPRIVRGGRVPPPRVVRYEEPPIGFPRRLLRFLLKPYIVGPALLIVMLFVSVMAYYWVIFSGRIDNLLKGEVFTRSAGIYAAPKQLRVGQALTEEGLIAFLKHAGYVEKSQQADKSRGRYYLSGSIVDVEPSDNTTVDGQQQFQRVRVQFSRTGKAISSI